MRGATLWVLLVVIVACAPAQEEMEQQAAEPERVATPAAAPETYPDPDEQVAQEVRDFVSGWVAEHAGEDGTYAIPPRAGHEVRGAMADFHTVHQSDADTYSVCLDFRGADQLYDVDFFVERTADGLVVADHYLHKIDGEVVE